MKNKFIDGVEVEERLVKNLNRQRDLQQYLSAQLKTLPALLNQIGAVALRDMIGDLQEAAAVVDKAIRTANQSASAVSAAAGHAAEAAALIGKQDQLNEGLADIITEIKLRHVWFATDRDAIRVVLEVVDPVTFIEVFGELPVARQAALTGLSLEDPEMATNKQQEEISGKTSSR